VTDRRQVLQALAALGSVGLPLAGRAWGTPPALPDDPFRLGVASGYPTSDSVVLWTRLAPQPLAPLGGMSPSRYAVDWEVATDAAMAQTVARGTTSADPAWAHSVHVRVQGLRPARDYWYRFTAAGHRSASARTRTLPAPGTPVAALDLAVVCCQNYEQGHYAAYRHIAADAPDLILHLGDYIYEYGINPNALRQHNSAEIRTLDEYRARYALYKTDTALQAAHAASPWMAVWDDHEVANDYAGLTSLGEDDPAVFLARRTAAYRAYFENMPLPPECAPRGQRMSITTQALCGDLASFCLLDQRQFRSRQRDTMLGAAQERWLAQRLHTTRARWTFLAQGTVISHLRERRDGELRYGTDNWNAYPQARQRLIDTVQQSRVSNPVVLTGDVHAFVVGHVTQTPARPESAVVAPEFVATSVSSGARPQRLMDEWQRDNANLRYCAGEKRGYLKLALRPDRLQVDLVALDDARDPQSGRYVLKSCTVEAGRPEIQIT
jgi:alkaline phosphatase D